MDLSHSDHILSHHSDQPSVLVCYVLPDFQCKIKTVKSTPGVLDLGLLDQILTVTRRNRVYRFLYDVEMFKILAAFFSLT